MRLGLGIKRAISRYPRDPKQIEWPFDIYAWLAELRPDERVLDIGAGEGSFPWTGNCHVVALDDNVDAYQRAADREGASYHRVFGRADRLPFAERSFDLVLCHHVLEHVAPVEAVLQEIARVLKPDGRLYVAVPNGYGLCDGVYRFVFEGGGHVNRFERQQLIGLVEQAAGMRLARWHKLYSSFAYLRRLLVMMRTPGQDLRPRLRRMGAFRWLLGGAQWMLYLGSRAVDRLFGTDWAVYGWALYFDRGAGAGKEDRAYVNVCLYCGAGLHSDSLYRPLRITYRCTVCDHVNPYVPPFRNTV
jgi:SAM-dependent methyltransferase